MKDKTSYKADFLELLRIYAALRFDQGGDLLSDKFMVRAIREGLWTPPEQPTKG